MRLTEPLAPDSRGRYGIEIDGHQVVAIVPEAGAVRFMGDISAFDEELDGPDVRRRIYRRVLIRNLRHVSDPRDVVSYDASDDVIWLERRVTLDRITPEDFADSFRDFVNTLDGWKSHLTGRRRGGPSLKSSAISPTPLRVIMP